MRNVKVAQLKPPTCQYCRLLGLCTLPVMHYLKSHELVPGIALHRSYYYHKYECSIFFVLILLVSNNVYFSFSLPAVNTAVCSLPVMCKTFCAIPELSRLQILCYIYSPHEFSAPGYQRAAANLECHVLYGILISTKRKEG